MRGSVDEMPGPRIGTSHVGIDGTVAIRIVSPWWLPNSFRIWYDTPP